MEPLLLLTVLAAAVLLALGCARGVLALIVHLMSGRSPLHLSFSAARRSRAALQISEHAQV